MRRIATVLFTGMLAFSGSVAFAGATAQAAGAEESLTPAQKEAFKGKTVAFVPLSLGFDLTDGWNAMVRQQLEPLGVKFIVRDPNWKTDAGAQAISTLITDKVDVLLIHNPDLQSYARLLKRAQEEGIYVVQINMQSSTHTDAFVGGDFVGNGEADANLMLKNCSPGKGSSNKIAVVQGVLTAAASVERMKGINNVLSKHPEINVVSNQAGDWDATKSRAITDTVLKQHPDLCGVIDFWDGAAVGSAAAIREAKKQGQVTLVATGGGEQAGCDNVSNGIFTVLDTTDVRRQSADIISAVKEVLLSKEKAGSKKRIMYTPLTFITKDTLAPDTCWKLSDYKAK
jgi:ribose transport system substrate-binding protein